MKASEGNWGAICKEMLPFRVVQVFHMLHPSPAQLLKIFCDSGKQWQKHSKLEVIIVKINALFMYLL